MATKQQELVFKLKFQARMLEKQSERELKNAEKERRLAQQFLRKGQKAQATLHAQNCVRANQLSQFLAENSGRVQAMACDVQMAQVQAQMSKTLATATTEMEKYINDCNLQKIAETAVKYDQIRGKVQQAQQILVPDDATVQMNADSLLADLEQELEQTALLGVDIPVGRETIPSAPVFEAAPI
jgi:charged multivesicular body protein 1